MGLLKIGDSFCQSGDRFDLIDGIVSRKIFLSPYHDMALYCILTGLKFFRDYLDFDRLNVHGNCSGIDF